MTQTGGVGSGTIIKIFLEAIVDPDDLIDESDETEADNTAPDAEIRTIP